MTAQPATEIARHWIDGERVQSATVARSVNPSTGEVLGRYSVEAAAAIAAARKAFDAGIWSHDPQLRSRALLELADRLDERADAIALTISREMGKTLGDATLEATWRRGHRFKAVDSTYRSGPCPGWIKVRSPASLAVQRERSDTWNR